MQGLPKKYPHFCECLQTTQARLGYVGTNLRKTVCVIEGRTEGSFYGAAGFT